MNSLIKPLTVQPVKSSSTLATSRIKQIISTNKASPTMKSFPELFCLILLMTPSLAQATLSQVEVSDWVEAKAVGAPLDTQSSGLHNFSYNAESDGVGSASANLNISLETGPEALTFVGKGTAFVSTNVAGMAALSSLDIYFETDLPCHYYIAGSLNPSNSLIALDSVGIPVFDSRNISGENFEVTGILPGFTGSNPQNDLIARASGGDGGPATFTVYFSIYPVVDANVPPPSPQIGLSTDGATVITWPRAATDVVLESCTNIAFPLWISHTNDVNTVGPNYSFTADLKIPSQFFRLSADGSINHHHAFHRIRIN